MLTGVILGLYALVMLAPLGLDFACALFEPEQNPFVGSSCAPKSDPDSACL
jgi:hypothetical protein